VILSALAIVLSALAAQAQSGKPHILVIMTDDVGVWNITAYHRVIMGGSTPNIDKIAQEGRFSTLPIAIVFGIALRSFT